MKYRQRRWQRWQIEVMWGTAAGSRGYTLYVCSEKRYEYYSSDICIVCATRRSWCNRGYHTSSLDIIWYNCFTVSPPPPECTAQLKVQCTGCTLPQYFNHMYACCEVKRVYCLVVFGAGPGQRSSKRWMSSSELSESQAVITPRSPTRSRQLTTPVTLEWCVCVCV